MKIGYIGLGKMGQNMVYNLLDHNHEVVAYNRSLEPVKEVEQAGAEGAYSYEELVNTLRNLERKIIWIMVPAGDPVDAVLEDITPLLNEGDIVIDGGNSRFTSSMERHTQLKEKGIHFIDVGVSGGPSGARHGACMMAGGEKEIYDVLAPLLADLCVENGYGYVGEGGAGHFVKMVHNGIEYGMMQAIAEGFDVIRQSDFSSDLEEVAKVYNNGSVIESRLIRWLKDGYKEFGPDLESVSGAAEESGEGRWTVEWAKDKGMSVDVIEDALDARLRSQEQPNYQGKIITLLRHQFGGHSLNGQ